MASFRKRGRKWQAQVKVGGKFLAKTFDTKAEALRWADARERGPEHTATLREAMEKYRDEVSVKKRGEKWERDRLHKMMREWPDVDRQIATITPADVAAWRDSRLTEVAPSSVAREMTLLSHLFRIAWREWGWVQSSPVSMVARPKQPESRSRSFSDDEIERICVALGWDNSTPQSASQRTAWTFLLALETAMRASEILSLTVENVGEKSVYLPETKNGTSRTVPLNLRARELMKMAIGLDAELVMPLGGSTRDTLFRRAMAAAGVEGATFHDSRRTATIRLAKKVDVMTLAKITGHRDLRVLLNTYYGVSADDVADRLD